MTLIRNERVERALDKRFRTHNGELEAWKLYKWGRLYEVEVRNGVLVAGHDVPYLQTPFQGTPITKLGWQVSSRAGRAANAQDDAATTRYGNWFVGAHGTIILGSHVFLSRAGALRVAAHLKRGTFYGPEPLYAVPVSVSANDLVAGGLWDTTKQGTSAVFMKHLITADHLRRGVRVTAETQIDVRPMTATEIVLLNGGLRLVVTGTRTTPAIDNPEYAAWVESLIPQPTEPEKVLV